MLMVAIGPHIGPDVAIGGLHVLSFFSSLWLVLQLYRLPRPCRSRLLPRQLLALAVADGTFHGAHAAYWMLQAFSIGECHGRVRSVPNYKVPINKLFSAVL